MHWDKDTLTAMAAVLTAVWTGANVLSTVQDMRAKRAIERAKIQQEEQDREDPDLAHERRAKERAQSDLGDCWEQVDRWRGEAERLEKWKSEHDARWAKLNMTCDDGLWAVRQLQDADKSAQNYEDPKGPPPQ